MIYVEQNDLMRIFKGYLADIDSELISKDEAIEQLADALEIAKYQEIDE